MHVHIGGFSWGCNVQVSVGTMLTGVLIPATAFRLDSGVVPGLWEIAVASQHTAPQLKVRNIALH